jgi:hypothetical protein
MNYAHLVAARARYHESVEGSDTASRFSSDVVASTIKLPRVCTLFERCCRVLRVK